MRVAQILYAGLGGHGSVAFSLLDADKEGQWQPLLGFLGIEPLSVAYSENCKERGIPFSYFAAMPGKPWKTWPRIAQWLKASRPDAIVLHSGTALVPCLWHARRQGIPLVVVEHQANALKKRSDWIFSHLAMTLADGVVVLTPDYQQELKFRLGMFYRSGRVHVIPNGINTNRFIPICSPVKRARTVRLGMASRFTKTKRHDVLMKMMVELHRREPEIDWHLSLAGDGERWADFRHEIKVRGFEESVTLPGQLDEPKLIVWYQSIDIYLHASEGETLSTSLLQAMATRLPIVASDVPGIRNLLGGEPTCGVLIEGQSPQGFAEAVIELSNKPSRAEALAQSGRRLAMLSYSQDKMFARYAKLFSHA